jgi:hypothetical protein
MSRRKQKADELATEYRAAFTEQMLWDKRLRAYSNALLEALMRSRGLTDKQAIRLIGEDGLDDNCNIIASKLPEHVRVAAKAATAKKYDVAARTVERWVKDGPDKLASAQETVRRLGRALEEERTPFDPLIDEFKALEGALPTWESHGDWIAVAITEGRPLGRGVLWRKGLLHFATRRVLLSRQLELRAFKSAQRVEKLEAENRALRKELQVVTTELKTEKRLTRDLQLARDAKAVQKPGRR